MCQGAMSVTGSAGIGRPTAPTRVSEQWECAAAVLLVLRCNCEFVVTMGHCHQPVHSADRLALKLLDRQCSSSAIPGCCHVLRHERDEGMGG